MDIKEFLNKYSSNTYASSGNQTLFYSDSQEHTGRIFYKIVNGGAYNYAFFFSDTIDSTFDGGDVSRAGTVCGGYTVTSLRAGICKRRDFEAFLAENGGISPETAYMSESSADGAVKVTDFKSFTFDGRLSGTVPPSGMIFTDPLTLEFDDGDFLCLEISYSGERIPYHNESIISAYVKDGDAWKYGKNMPFPCIIGCDRPVRARVAYIGDSITQGSGTPRDSYTHWCAVVSRGLDRDLAYWNLGYGFARSHDAAADGSWLYKAKQNDIVCVCFGVNDILRGRTAEQIKTDLGIIVDRLKHVGARVLVQTPPPFDYGEDKRLVWEEVNAFILGELSEKADAVFDNSPILGKEDARHMAKYGGHPNSEGCALWGEALTPTVKKLCDTL